MRALNLGVPFGCSDQQWAPHAERQCGSSKHTLPRWQMTRTPIRHGAVLPNRNRDFQFSPRSAMRIYPWTIASHSSWTRRAVCLSFSRPDTTSKPSLTDTAMWRTTRSLSTRPRLCAPCCQRRGKSPNAARVAEYCSPRPRRADPILAPIVELGGAGGGMGCHLACLLQRASVLKIGSDARAAGRCDCTLR